MKFKNRTDAGRQLATKLTPYQDKNNVLVLALPRGGVPVAHPIAEKLHCPLDLLLVKKLGVPDYEELAMGAMAFLADPVFNEDILVQSRISSEQLKKIIAEKQLELSARNTLYRHDKAAPDVKNKIIIMVDDGIATGASVRAAILAIKNQQPEKIIVAVPVADKTICDALSAMVDEVICLYQPPQLSAVGLWYEDFTQTTDEEVIAIMKGLSSSRRDQNC